MTTANELRGRLAWAKREQRLLMREARPYRMKAERYERAADKWAEKIVGLKADLAAVLRQNREAEERPPAPPPEIKLERGPRFNI